MKTKVCSQCGKEKSLDRFAFDNRTKDGRDPRCKVCKSRATLNWATNNPEQAILNTQKYKTQLKKNGGTLNLSTSKRRRNFIQYTGKRCMKQDCTLSITKINPLGIDHIRAVILGGQTSAENIQVLCRVHNAEKGIAIIDYRTKNDIRLIRKFENEQK